jgi:hypothetical protein
MKPIGVLIAILVCLSANDGRAQWSRGGSGGRTWGGSSAGSNWGAPAGRQSQAAQPPSAVRQAPVRPPQTHWNVPGVQPVPPRPGATRNLPRPALVDPNAPRSSRVLPAPSWRSPHWRRDRFFKHRHFHGFVLVPGFIGGTTVITEVAPGVIREERRYLPEAKPEAAPIREPGQLAPYDPTPHEVVERMLALAEIRDNDVVYDLGSGDGRLLIAAAKKYRARGVGFDIGSDALSILRWQSCRARTATAPAQTRRAHRFVYF